MVSKAQIADEHRAGAAVLMRMLCVVADILFSDVQHLSSHYDLTAWSFAIVGFDRP